MENLNFNEVIKNFKKEFNMQTDSEVYTLLSISKSNFSDRKKRNSIPYQEIIKICEINSISTDKVFFGYENNDCKENFKEKLKEKIDLLSKDKAEYYYYKISADLIEEKF